MLRDMAKCAKHRNDSHACNNLQKLLHKSGHQLRVRFSFISTPVRLAPRGVTKKALVKFPLLKLSDWCQTIFSKGGHCLLGGQNLDQAKQFGLTLRLFWERFKIIEPQLPFFNEPGHNWDFCIPFLLHGDEGRGSAKRPVLVLSAQPMITSPDMSTSNLKGSQMLHVSRILAFIHFMWWSSVYTIIVVPVRHTFCSRLLLTVIPSGMYVKDHTLQTLLGAVVNDINTLHHDGVQASSVVLERGGGRGIS